MFDDLPESWKTVLADELEKPYVTELAAFVTQERNERTVYPPHREVFNAFKHTPYQSVKVLLLGQDPYHGPGQAHGLCFSVLPGVRPPPSLNNMFKELQDDLGIDPPDHGYLARWAEQGVMMLNAVLTVRRGQAASHQGKGWERFTDTVIRRLSQRPEPVVFVLWGGFARKKAKLIERDQNPIVESAHPSPLSAQNGFFGSRPYSRINEALRAQGDEPIDWRLPSREQLGV
jgi:uracil-DNA glycosylase